TPGQPGNPDTPTEPEPPIVPDPPDPVTPATGQTSWFSSTIAEDGSHRSFIRYITNTFMCPGNVGTVTLSGGIATAPAPADPTYDFLVDQVSATSTTLQHRGRIRYQMACHGINQWVENLEFTDLDEDTGRVLADGSHGDRNNPSAPDVLYTDEHLLNLDLKNATKTVTAEGTRYDNVKSTVAAGAQDELGSEYPAGSEWGVFSFTLPKQP
ncbi:MAG TPA: HtaA domain-containing protein, partial [Solirubrobacteraceae bacterium]|nr:HtaA domain-containing protein [Solirubrobacteraceae bacterium]